MTVSGYHCSLTCCISGRHTSNYHASAVFEEINNQEAPQLLQGTLAFLPHAAHCFMHCKHNDNASHISRHRENASHISIGLLAIGALPLRSGSACRLLVLRYGHWTVATPMIVYLISRLSDFSLRRTIGVALAQAGVIITGFLALVLPLEYECRSQVSMV